jgi:peroxiredoxin Q/BCP
MLAIGDKIPEFELKNQDGQLISISPDDGKLRVIYFYPKDNTKKCTEQACSFRDWQDDLIEKGIEVIGISGDSPTSHLKFKSRYSLDFLLLSDPKGKVRKLFGATTFFGMLPSRKTFVINKDGKITFIYEALFEGQEHVNEVLKELKRP